MSVFRRDSPSVPSPSGGGQGGGTLIPAALDSRAAIRAAKIHHCCDPARWGQGMTQGADPADEPVLQSHLQGIFTLAEGVGFPLFSPEMRGDMPIGPRLILVLDNIYDKIKVEILDPGDVAMEWTWEICWWIINGRPSSPSEWWPLHADITLPRFLCVPGMFPVAWSGAVRTMRIGISPDHPDSGYAFRLVPRDVRGLKRSPVIGRIMPVMNT